MNFRDPQVKARLKKHFAAGGVVRCSPDQLEHGGGAHWICVCDKEPKMGTPESVAVCLEYDCGCAFAYHLKCAPPPLKQMANRPTNPLPPGSIVAGAPVVGRKS